MTIKTTKAKINIPHHNFPKFDPNKAMSLDSLLEDVEEKIFAMKSNDDDTEVHDDTKPDKSGETQCEELW